MRGKAARALLRYTKTAVQDLQHDEDEMLRGKSQPSHPTSPKNRPSRHAVAGGTPCSAAILVSGAAS